jgi:hypothetical protein
MFFASANDVQDALRRIFRIDDPDARWAMIAEFIQTIKRDINAARNLRLSSGLQRQLESACEQVTRMKIEIDHKLYPAWAGGYAVVLLGPDGSIVAASQIQTGLVYDVYGHDGNPADLLPFAIIKAILQRQLSDLGPGYTDLSTANTFDYFTSKLRQASGNDSLRSYVGQGRCMPSGTQQWFMIGASGCGRHPGLDSFYLSEGHHDDMAVANDKAGLFDREFARLVAETMDDLGMWESFLECAELGCARIGN